MTPDELQDRHPRVSRQGTGLHQVRRHGALRAPGVHRLLAGGAAGDRRGGAQARARRRDARDHDRRPAAVDSTPASISSSIPRVLGTRELPDALVRAIVEQRHRLLDAGQHHHRRCVDQHLKTRDEARQKRAEAEKKAAAHARDRDRRPSGGSATPRTGSELEMRRKNAQKLIAAGAIVTVGHRQLLGGGAGVRAHAEAGDAGSWHRHDHRHRRARRAGHDAGAGDRWRRRGTARLRRAARSTSGRFGLGKRARSRRARRRSAGRHPATPAACRRCISDGRRVDHERLPECSASCRGRRRRRPSDRTPPPGYAFNPAVHFALAQEFCSQGDVLRIMDSFWLASISPNSSSRSSSSSAR